MSSQLFKTSEEIDVIVRRVANAINEYYANTTKDDTALVVCSLKGAVYFFADLTRLLTFPMEIDFIRVSSYGMRHETSGKVELLADVASAIEGRRVLIVEDIVETGTTLESLRRYFFSRGARDVKIAVLVDKPKKRKVEVQVDFIGTSADADQFLYGYGLDSAEHGRTLPELRYD